MKINLKNTILALAAFAMVGGVTAAGVTFGQNDVVATHAVSTATYAVTSSSAVSASGAPTSASASYSSTYATACQLTKNNSMTLTLSGYDGCTISGLTLSMKSNTKGGAGSLSVTIGDAVVASIANSSFNTDNWNGNWSTSYVDISPSFTTTTVGTGEDIEIVLAATANSLFCQSFTVSYEEPKAEVVTNVGIISGMSKTSYTSDDETWSLDGLESQVTTESGNPWVGPINYAFNPATPLAALAIEDWDGKVSISATAGEVTSEAFIQEGVSVSWLDGSEGLPYSVADAISSAAEDKNTTKYVTGYVAKISGTNIWLVDSFADSLSGTYDDDTSWELYRVSSVPAGLALGDKVVAGGKVTTYGNQCEFASGTTEFVSRVSNALTALHVSALDMTHREGQDIIVGDFTFTADYGTEFGLAITSGISISSSAAKYSAGSNEIEFSYTERGVTKTASIIVVAEADTREFVALSIAGSMEGKAYFNDEDWDASVLSFALVYDDDDTSPVASDSPFLDFEFQDENGTPVAKPAAGMTEVYVYAIYDDGDVSFDQTLKLEGFTVTAVSVTELEWTDKDVSFEAGSTFSLKGTITAKYNKSSHNKEIDLSTEGVTATLAGNPISTDTELNLGDDGKTLVISYGGASVQATISVYKNVVIPGETDQITRALTGVSGTSYSAWTNKTSNSDAVYAGNSAGGNDSIQLRTNNSNSGVVTTASGGTALRVSIEWNSNTSAGRKVQVYGKNSAYESAADLYNDSKKGTLLGTLSYDTNDTSIIVNDGYQYIGIKSSSGALYLDSIAIDWGDIAATADVIAVESFIETYMHLDHTTNDGSCVLWYNDAKDHFAGNTDKAIAGLTTAQKEIILKSDSIYSGEWKYSDVAKRLAAWAEINHDTFNTETGVFTAGAVSFLNGSSESSALPLFISLLAVAGLATGGMILLSKKRKRA